MLQGTVSPLGPGVPQKELIHRCVCVPSVTFDSMLYKTQAEERLESGMQCLGVHLMNQLRVMMLP